MTYRNIDAQSETVKRDVLFVPGLTAYNTQLTDLAAGSTYLITVLAVSNDIQSDSLQKTQTTSKYDAWQHLIPGDLPIVNREFDIINKNEKICRSGKGI